MPTLKERRKRKRKNMLEKAAAEILGPPELSGDKQIYFSFTQDVSLDGIKIITDTLLPDETLLGIKLSISAIQKPLNLKGKVKWTKKYQDKELYETGLEFVDTSQESILTLMEFIYKRENNSDQKQD